MFCSLPCLQKLCSSSASCSSDVWGSTLSNMVVHRISSEHVCVRCFNPFLLRSSLVANRRSPAGAPTSVCVGEHEVEPPGGGKACPEPGHFLAPIVTSPLALRLTFKESWTSTECSARRSICVAFRAFRSSRDCSNRRTSRDSTFGFFSLALPSLV